MRERNLEEASWYVRAAGEAMESGPLVPAGVARAWEKGWLGLDGTLRRDPGEGWATVREVIEVTRAVTAVCPPLEPRRDDELDDAAWSVREAPDAPELGPVSVLELKQLVERFVVDDSTEVRAWNESGAATLGEFLELGVALDEQLEVWRLPHRNEHARRDPLHAARIAAAFDDHLALGGHKRWFAGRHVPDEIADVVREERARGRFGERERVLGFGGARVRNVGLRGLLASHRALYDVSDDGLRVLIPFARVSTVLGYADTPNHPIVVLTRANEYAVIPCRGFGAIAPALSQFLARVPRCFEPPQSARVIIPLHRLADGSVVMPNVCAGTLRAEPAGPPQRLRVPSDPGRFLAERSVDGGVLPLPRAEDDVILDLPVSARCRERQVARVHDVVDGHVRVIFFNRAYGELFAERNRLEAALLDQAPESA